MLPDSTDDKTVVWSSSNTNIAIVDENTGVVTGVAVGKATIKATCGDVFGTIEIDVKDPTNLPFKLAIGGELTTTNYFVGETFDPSGLTVNVMYTDETIVDVTNDVTWNLGVLNEVGDAIQVIATYTFDNNGTPDSISSEDNITIKVVEKALEGLLVDGLKTSYTTDDTELDLSGMTVEASYVNSNRYIDVTDKVTIEGTVDFTDLGTQTINVVYSEDGDVVKEPISITVTLAHMTIKVVSGESAPVAYEKVTQNLDDWSGEYLIVYEDGNVAFNGVDEANGNYAVTIENGKIAKLENSDQVSLVFEKMEGGYSIKINGGTNDGKYIGKTANSNGLNIGATKYLNEISFVDSAVSIKSSGGAYFRYNANSDQQRFRYFASKSYTSQKAISLYKLTGGQTTTEYTVSSFLYQTIQEADAALVCGNSSTGTWVDGTYDVETAKGYLDMVEAADLEALKSAQANENGNLVEKFLWKYDYLVATGKIENFLNRSVVSQARINPFITNANSETTIAIIVVISLVAVSSIGGYLFIRKRKEQ